MNWDGIVTAMPPRLAEDVKGELDELGADPASPGHTLARLMLTRIADYASNMFFRSYLKDEELESYVRTNVRHHLNEDLGPLSQLARHAVEVQYLGLASFQDPIGYFLETSYFEAYFVETRVFSEREVRALFEATARLCACYELDRSAFVAHVDD